jgi:hypothetical protein
MVRGSGFEPPFTGTYKPVKICLPALADPHTQSTDDRSFIILGGGAPRVPHVSDRTCSLPRSPLELVL